MICRGNNLERVDLIYNNAIGRCWAMGTIAHCCIRLRANGKAKLFCEDEGIIAGVDFELNRYSILWIEFGGRVLY